jgi:3-oxoacyl-[acyl-carrier-protein] synthase-3
MSQNEQRQWPHYTYIVPEIYTRAQVQLTGLGTYNPHGIITNDFFASIVTRLGTPKRGEDLERVTGLKTRHVRSSTIELCRKMAGQDAPGLIDDPENRNESLVDMAVIAAQRALASAGRTAAEIDTIVATSSSDNDGFPTVASWVQARLGMRTVRSLMIKGACSCQSEVWQTAAEILVSSSAKCVLVVAPEGLLPNIMHVLDWKTSSLFGEGAAAFILERGNEDTYFINGSDANQAPALLYKNPLRKDVVEIAEEDLKIRQLFQDGRATELNALLSRFLIGYAKMNGKEVYREAPRAMAESVDALARIANMDPDTIKHIVPHQANSRMTERLGDLLIRDYGWPNSVMQKLVHNFSTYGNLSNASVGMALMELLRQKKLQAGDWMALTSVGGGMSFGAWLTRFDGLRYPEEVNPEN